MSSRKSPAKSSQIDTTKIPWHISAEEPANNFDVQSTKLCDICVATKLLRFGSPHVEVLARPDLQHMIMGIVKNWHQAYSATPPEHGNKDADSECFIFDYDSHGGPGDDPAGCRIFKSSYRPLQTLRNCIVDKLDSVGRRRDLDHSPQHYDAWSNQQLYRWLHPGNSIRTGTGWRTSFRIFRPPGPYAFPENKQKSFVPVIFSPIKILDGPGTGTRVSLPCTWHGALNPPRTTLSLDMRSWCVTTTRESLEQRRRLSSCSSRSIIPVPASTRSKGGSFFTYSWSFLLAVELLCLQSIEMLIRCTFPL